MIQEQLVLAAILIDNRHMKKSMTMIEPSDFVDFKNKCIYQGMLQLHHNNMEIDYGTLINYLDSHKTGVTIDYLIDISNMLPTAEAIDSYLAQLKELSNKRKLKKAFDDILKDDSVTSQEASNYLNNVIDSLEHVDNEPVQYVHDGLEEKINSLSDGKYEDNSHKTLYTKLDEIVAIQDGDYILIAGFTGTGKSALAMNISMNFGLQGKKGLFISGEMTNSQYQNRLLANVSGVANKKIQRMRNITSDELLSINKNYRKIKKLNIMVHDSGSMTVEHIVNKCRKLKQKNNLDYLVVDHVGLIGTTKRCSNKTQELTHVSNTLKQLALSLKIPIIVLSQFSRKATDPHTGKRREPVKEDLKDSGSLEHDSNVIILLYSTAPNVEEFTNRYMILKIEKNRDGECSKIPVVFKADKQMFREVNYDRDTQTSTEMPLSKV